MKKKGNEDLIITADILNANTINIKPTDNSYVNVENLKFVKSEYVNSVADLQKNIESLFNLGFIVKVEQIRKNRPIYIEG